MKNWELIGKKLSGELNAGEAQRFEAWLNSDVAHKAIWEDAEKIWLATGKIHEAFDPDTEKALSRFKATRETGKIISLKKFFTPLKVAAAVALIAIPVTLFILFTGEEKKVIVAAQKHEAPVPVFVKEKKTITLTATDSAISFYLPDNTHIYLNTHSSIVYPEDFNLTARTITLTGEAFFEVMPDTKKPFIIQAGNTETKVVGTSFNIKEDAQTKKVEVTVLTGQVKFKVKKNSEHLSEVTLIPQDHVTYSESSATMVKRKAKDSESYWWKKNLKAIRKLLHNAKELTRPKKK